MNDLLLYIGFAVSVLLNIFQFVAPRTKNTVDDKIRDGLAVAD